MSHHKKHDLPPDEPKPGPQDPGNYDEPASDPVTTKTPTGPPDTGKG